MKYFNKEELDFIVNELINNPTKETIKKLNSKYNGDTNDNNGPTWIENNSPIETVSVNSIPANNANNLFNNNEVIPSETSKNTNQNIPAYSSIYRTEYEPQKDNAWNPINNATTTNIYNSNMSTLNNTSGVTEYSQNNNGGIAKVPNLNIQNDAFNNTQNNNNQSNMSGFNIPNLSMPDITPEPERKIDINNNNNPILLNNNLWEMQDKTYNSMMQTTDNFNNTIEQPSNTSVSIQPMPFFNSKQNIQQNQIPISEPPKEDGPTMLGQLEQNYNNNAA